eukprot:SAG31_NODE_5784_length_2330_cov_2.435679_2_plen_174_part_00
MAMRGRAPSCARVRLCAAATKTARGAAPVAGSRFYASAASANVSAPGSSSDSPAVQFGDIVKARFLLLLKSLLITKFTYITLFIYLPLQVPAAGRREAHRLVSHSVAHSVSPPRAPRTEIDASSSVRASQPYQHRVCSGQRADGHEPLVRAVTFSFLRNYSRNTGLQSREIRH